MQLWQFVPQTRNDITIFVPSPHNLFWYPRLFSRLWAPSWALELERVWPNCLPQNLFVIHKQFHSNKNEFAFDSYNWQSAHALCCRESEPGFQQTTLYPAMASKCHSPIGDAFFSMCTPFFQLEYMNLGLHFLQLRDTVQAPFSNQREQHSSITLIRRTWDTIIASK